MATLLLTTLLLPLAGALLLRGDRAWSRHWRWRSRCWCWAWRPCWWRDIRAAPSPSPPPIWPWLGWAGAPVDIRFSVALDGLSLWLFGLTALLDGRGGAGRLGGDRRAGVALLPPAADPGDRHARACSSPATSFSSTSSSSSR